MKKVQIKDKGETCIEFLKKNFLGLEGKNVYISHSIFQEIWKECDVKKGNVSIHQPKDKPTKNNFYGIYQFDFVDNDKYGIPFETKVVIKNNGIIKQEKQLQIVFLKTKNLNLSSSNKFLNSSVFFTRDKVKKTFLGMEL